MSYFISNELLIFSFEKEHCVYNLPIVYFLADIRNLINITVIVMYPIY